MVKRLVILVGILAVSFVAAIPALAQGAAPEAGPKDAPSPVQEGTPRQVSAPKEEPEDDVPPGPPPGEETATLSFELTVEGEPPTDATFFGNLQTGEGGPGSFTPLTDPDGDGVYTGTTTTPRFGPGPRPVPPGIEPLSFGVRIVQGTGTQGSIPAAPVTVIKDFGAVPMNDQTFSASTSFPSGPGPGNPDDEVTVTFELTIDGEVPEGRSIGVSTGIQDIANPVFCTTAGFGDLPFCEDGETYSDTFEVPANRSFSYEYTVVDYDYGGVVESFAADTRTFTEDETVSATYRAGDPDNEVTVVEATGTLEKPGATTYQYGTHAITDEASDTFYALRSNVVDLDDYLDERVTLYGALAPGYEAGQVEGGPPLIDVYKVDATGDPGEENVAVTFELTVEGEPPTDTTFFGYLGYEPAPFRLTDPDGDGIYTGSTPSDLVTAGDTQPALIVQGTGTRESQVVGTSPGDPVTTIKDFGEVTFEEDTSTLR